MYMQQVYFILFYFILFYFILFTYAQDKLQAQFEEMKYSGEERMSSGQRLLEEVQTHLNEAKSRQGTPLTLILVSPSLSLSLYDQYITGIINMLLMYIGALIVILKLIGLVDY